MNSNVEAKLKIMPDSPGVYIMKDARQAVLYVGKAKSLHKRVKSYFTPGRDSRNSVLVFVPKVKDIDYLLTDNEKEAFLLENNLIKKLKPRYNINLRDDKDFLCIRINTEENFPRMLFVRRPRNDGAKYFGPYASSYLVKQLLRSLGKVFPLRRCSDHVFKNRSRPCILHQIKLCQAPCVGLTTKEEYSDLVKEVISFLSGNTREILRDFTKRMKIASSQMNYEEAAELRDKIKAIDEIMTEQKIVRSNFKNQDVFGFARDKEHIGISLLTVREGRLQGGKNFKLKSKYLSDSEIFTSLLGQYYLNKTAFIPSEIIIPSFDIDKGLISESLSSRELKVSIKVPKRGEAFRLVKMAHRNAYETIATYVKEERASQRLLEKAQVQLKLTNIPSRIEGYDISNIQGTNAVGSMVVFTNGKPDSKAYRKFKIKTVKGPDDYSMMNEVLSRRLSNESIGPLPDLIVIDGGKGQLAIALDVLKDKSYMHIDTISIAKEKRSTDRIVKDRVYVKDRKNPLSLKQNSDVLYLIGRVRDEAHRFAVSYHRKLRSALRQSKKT